MSIFNNPRDVSFTIGGEKFKGVLTKDLEMANKEKYIPKVGEKCEMKLVTGFGFTYTIIVRAEYDDKLWVSHTDLSGDHVIDKSKYNFNPISIKADVEREQLGNIINQNVSWENVVKEIQKAGFTIPKKVKRSEIADVVANTSPMISVEDLVDEICNLLGDLVEDDQ